MASNTWGVGRPGGDEAKRPRPKGKRAALTPQASQAAHRGIVWLHASAIAIWLLVGLTFGILLAAGKNVPGVIVIACAGAALGHLLFLSAHLFLARKARARRAAA